MGKRNCMLRVERVALNTRRGLQIARSQISVLSSGSMQRGRAPVLRLSYRKNRRRAPARRNPAPRNGVSLPSENLASPGINLRTPFDHSSPMPGSATIANEAKSWTPIPDPGDRYSSGIPDFDRLLGGGFKRGSLALFEMDETVGQDDLDLLLFPTILNLLYQSRGVVAVLPSVDSPHDFRARMSRFVTRRRFDNRVRVVDYTGEDEGLAYVVSLKGMNPNPKRVGTPNWSSNPKVIQEDVRKMQAAERAAQGNRKKSYLELNSIEVADTLAGGEAASRMFFYGVKRARSTGNLVIGLLTPGVECAAVIRRMADAKFKLHRDEVGLIIRGLRPSFPSYLVSEDHPAGPPHVAFVPRPP
jgi:hypothetical protein